MAIRNRKQGTQAENMIAAEESDPEREDGAAPVNRRRALALGAAAAAGALVAGARQPQAALAADGDPLKLGNANLAEHTTTLDSDGATADFALFVVGTLTTVGSTGPMVEGWNNGTGEGVYGHSQDGEGVHGHSSGLGPGVLGENAESIAPPLGPGPIGVKGISLNGVGVYGENDGPAVAEVAGIYGFSGSNPGVYGNSTNGSGVVGTSANDPGVYGSSAKDSGVYGSSTDSTVPVIGPGPVGVKGVSANGSGVYGESQGPVVAEVAGIYGISTNNVGVEGTSTNNVGVYGNSASAAGVYGTSTNNDGVLGSVNSAADGVRGENAGSGCGVEGINTGSGAGVCGEASGSGAGVHATNTGSGPALRVDGPAVFNGPVQFAGVGVATLPPRASAVTVTNSTVTPQSVVLLTLQGTSRPNEPLRAPAPYWVTVAPGSFTIHYGGQSADPLTFGYLVLSA